MCGVAIYAAARLLAFPVPLTVAGDTFFLVYLCQHMALVVRLNHEDLDRHASEEDEGILIIVLLTLAAMTFNAIDIFTALNQTHLPSRFDLALALSGAPLGWATLHTISAFHYANLHYVSVDEDTPSHCAPLQFPETGRPGPWDFMYFSFVIGMTAQVSDVIVQTTRMRRAVLFHSVVSFFFNTVLIAMAVNVAVAAFQTTH